MRPALALSLLMAALPLCARADAPPAPREIRVTAAADSIDSQTGTSFRLTAVTDQRCPADVACYWEGVMRVEITARSEAGTRVLILCNLCDDGERIANLPQMVVRFDGLEPSTEDLERKARLPVLQDYTVRLTLTGP